MKETRVTTSAIEAARFIAGGGIVAFPTETVYGLGANVFDAEAITRIFEAKRRPPDNPLIAHVSSVEQIEILASEITNSAGKLIERFFPGPLTVVVNKRDSVPGMATAGLNSIGVRMPRNELAREFLIACGTPLVAPSANLSGRPSPTTWQAVYEDLNGRIDCILQGDPTEIGLESTVVDCRTETPIVLRLGAVSLEDIRSAVPEAQVMTADSGQEVRSPGLRHKHYSPRARVEFSDRAAHDSGRAAFIGLHQPDQHFEFVKIAGTIEGYAASLFEFFRECDRLGIEKIYCEPVERVGIGAALMDRIERASAAGE